MSYSSKSGRRPFEAASKASHHHLINDPSVTNLLNQLYRPERASFDDFAEIVHRFSPDIDSPIEAIVAVDGGYTEATIQKEFPSRKIHFLQFGALAFKTQDLRSLEESRFIAPEDMAKLKNLQRLKLSLPTKNLRLEKCESLTDSILTIIYEFFRDNSMEEGTSLLDTVAWFLFRRYKGSSRTADDRSWLLATNPYSQSGDQVLLQESDMDTNYTFPCPATQKRIHITDVFRLHEAIDEEAGASGILGYLVNVVEHFIIVHLIRSLLAAQRTAIHRVMFIKDGPTGFFGQTARLHAPMADLVAWLHEKHNLYLVGLEKSGAFVDHAQEIEDRLPNGSIVILNDEYIYKHILPGQPDPSRPYASTSNYGHKIFYRTPAGQIHVVSIPVARLKKDPCIEDLKNLRVLLSNVTALHCDMYDAALFPVALVNRLVSLAAHPSQRILQRFASSSVA